MNESLDRPANDRGGIGEAVTTALRQPSFLRVMLFLSATVVVLAGMRLGAPILNPIFFAVVLALLFSPIYAWLRRHKIPTPLALVIMLVGLTLLFGGISLILGVSISRFSGEIGSYTGQLSKQADNIQDMAKSLGISNVNLQGRRKTQRPDRSYQPSPFRGCEHPEQPLSYPDDRAVPARRGACHDASPAG